MHAEDGGNLVQSASIEIIGGEQKALLGALALQGFFDCGGEQGHGSSDPVPAESRGERGAIVRSHRAAARDGCDGSWSTWRCASVVRSQPISDPRPL